LNRSKAGEVDDPGDLPDAGEWTGVAVPGTVAETVGPEGYDTHDPYDASDWWYRCHLPVPPEVDSAHRVQLRFDGLATLADVWFNGTHILHSANMFTVHEVDVTDLVRANNEIAIVFRSLDAALSERRPRPRWKTNLVSHQQLRWHRTTLLGRMPGWTPAIQPVGPWRSVWLEAVTGPEVTELDMKSTVDGERGVVTVRAVMASSEGDAPPTGMLTAGGIESPIHVARKGDGYELSGTIEIEKPDLWWPRTHGEPHLYPVQLLLSTGLGDSIVACGDAGFRTVEIDQTDGRLRFVVNGVDVFCRGACWTTNDIVTLGGSTEHLRDTLRQAAALNANMIRVGGTMVYESDDFYSECDRLGLMIWQDFMFANMDYPFDDPDFRREVDAEVAQQLRRLSRHASVVAFCGGSEIEQQAAMFGASREIWRHDFLAHDLARMVKECGSAAYWPSTPTGGALPFHVGEGLAHYYGVGAYRRPLEDVRLADVKFTPECLGFSNVPEPENVKRLGHGTGIAPHHPAWKKGVPRDTGAGWDFEDVRDHYLETLYEVDPVSLRAEDPERYMRLSRTITGRVMARVFDEWRSAESDCGGGLVWFLKDLRPGAGWGMLDSEGRPKPAAYYLKRAWAPLRLTILDRGLDGLRIEVHNESASPLSGQLAVHVYGSESGVQAHATRSVSVGARSTTLLVLEELLGHFADPAYTYRFGPRRHAAVGARFEAHGLPDPLTALYWPSLATPLATVDLEGELHRSPGSGSVTATSLAQDVRLELRGADASDNYFDVAPGDTKWFSFEPSGDPGEGVRGFVSARNAPDGNRLSTCD